MIRTSWEPAWGAPVAAQGRMKASDAEGANDSFKCTHTIDRREFQTAQLGG